MVARSTARHQKNKEQNRWEDVLHEKTRKKKTAGYYLKIPVRGKEESALRHLLEFASGQN